MLKTFTGERTEQLPEIRATRIVGRQPCMDHRVWKMMSTRLSLERDDVFAHSGARMTCEPSLTFLSLAVSSFLLRNP